MMPHRLFSFSFVIAVVVLLNQRWVHAGHHHHQQQPQPTEQQAVYWLDKSVLHDANSPMMYSYQPDDDDYHKDKKRNDINDWPWFTKGPLDSRANLCRKYSCPDFNSTSFPTFTKRSYTNTTVACTTIREFKPLKFGEAEAFKRLYEYFGGENDGNIKLNMTVPVVRYVEPGIGNLQDGSHPNVTVCFFLPDSQSTNPPVPKNSDVHVQPCSFDVLVHPFEGFSTHENVGKALGQFELILHLAGVDFNKDKYVHAAYTEPWILWPRYNEIWLMQGEAIFMRQPQQQQPSHEYGPGGPARLRVHHGKHHVHP